MMPPPANPLALNLRAFAALAADMASPNFKRDGFARTEALRAVVGLERDPAQGE